MKTSDSVAFDDAQSASLPGSTDEPSTVLRRTRSRTAFAASAAFAAAVALSTIAERLRPPLQEVGELLGDDLADDAAHLGVAELGFVCLELGLAERHRHHRRQPLARTRPRGRALLLQLAVGARERVHDARIAARSPSTCEPPLGVRTTLKPTIVSVYASAASGARCRRRRRSRLHPHHRPLLGVGGLASPHSGFPVQSDSTCRRGRPRGRRSRCAAIFRSSMTWPGRRAGTPARRSARRAAPSRRRRPP